MKERVQQQNVFESITRSTRFTSPEHHTLPLWGTRTSRRWGCQSQSWSTASQIGSNCSEPVCIEPGAVLETVFPSSYGKKEKRKRKKQGREIFLWVLRLQNYFKEQHFKPMTMCHLVRVSVRVRLNFLEKKQTHFQLRRTQTKTQTSLLFFSPCVM